MPHNMLIHGVPYKEFTVFNDDTIEHDNFGETKFQVQVANPLYSEKWSSGSKFESDPHFSNFSVLAPKSYADLMFLEHIDKDGKAAVLLPHGVLFRSNKETIVLYRSGEEQERKQRKYLVL